MRQVVLYSALIHALTSGSVSVQTEQVTPGGGGLLATVRMPVTVVVGHTTLAPGTYEIRLTGQRPAPLPGQPANAQEWVEFVADGKVVAREAAEILYDDDLTPIGASSQPVRSGTRVDMLQGGEFLRISVKRDRERYLIHLPVKR